MKKSTSPKRKQKLSPKQIKVYNLNLIKTILLISITICLVILIISNKNRIERIQAKNSNQAIAVTAKETNPNNFDYVTSLDGIDVPVPKGYTASSVEDEKYVNGVNEPYYFKEELTYKEPEYKYYLKEQLGYDYTSYYEKQELTFKQDTDVTEDYYLQGGLTFTSSGTYPWTYDETLGGWKSGNKGVNSSTSTLTSNSFTVGSDGGIIKINWCVSSERNYDKLKATIKNASTGSTVATTTEYSGTSWGTAESSLNYFDNQIELSEGTYIIDITYTKDSSVASGLDTAYLKYINLYTTEENENETIEKTVSYAWIKNDQNIWSSGNNGVQNSTSILRIEEFTVTEETEVLNIIWSVSQYYEASGSMKAVATNVDTGATVSTTNYSGTNWGTAESSLTYFNTILKLTAGTYKLDITYTKGNSSSSYGLDKAYVKSAKLYTSVQNGNQELKIGNNTTYPWIYNNDLGAWKSSNQCVNSATSTFSTNTFTVGEGGGFIRINWSISSESSDYMKATVVNEDTGANVATTTNYSGTGYGSTETGLTYVNAPEIWLEQGTYFVDITYTKNNSTHTGLDTAYLKSINLYTEEQTENSYELFVGTNNYAWSKNSSNIWVSGNYNVSSSESTLTSNNFTVDSETYVKINYSVSSEGANDYLKAIITNVDTNEKLETDNYSGTSLGTTESALSYKEIQEKIQAGTYKIDLIYTKNASTNTGLDRAYIKNVEVYTKNNTGSQKIITKRFKSGGFVIYEGEGEVTDSNLWDAQISRNQYVWIPISLEEARNMYNTSGNKIYGNYYNFTTTGYEKKSWQYEPKLLSAYDKDEAYLKRYMNGITKYEFQAEMEKRFYEMLESVATYGGFYVGRYETGDLSKGTPKVVRMNADVHTANWYKMYQRSKRVKGAKSTVDTNMIWGIQFDEVLKWLIDTKEKTPYEIRTDSTSWGNYQNSTFTYYTNTSKGTGTKRASSSTRISSGASDYCRANNIYDLAGNVLDRTMESNGSGYRNERGGWYSNYAGNSFPAYYRGDDNPGNSDNNTGTRLVLYVL